MGYHIYTTDGIILKRTTFGEANVLLYILTSDLGLIIASARSARLAVSKLRPALQEYALVSISCIKGKNGWKVTNVVEMSNFYFDSKSYQNKIISQVSFMLLKMIPGESPQKEIFQTIKSGFDFLLSLKEDEVKSLEVLLVFRVLHQLGYVGHDHNTDNLLKNTKNWDKSILEELNKNKKNVILLINKALKESHL